MRPAYIVVPVVVLAAIVLAALGLRTWLVTTDRDAVAERSVDAPASSTVHVPAPEPAPELPLAVVVPRREVDLSATSLARVARVAVGTGDRVDADAPLVELDVDHELSALASARASARASHAEIERRRLESRRSADARTKAEQLGEFVPRDEVDRLRHDEGIARAGERRAAADAQVESAQIAAISRRIEDGVLKSPFAAVVVQRFAEEGAVVAAGDPIVRLISQDTIVRFAVREDRPIELGMPIVVAFDDLRIRVATTVAAIVPEIDPAARIVVVEAALPLSPADATRVRVGAFGRVHFAER